MKPDYKNWVPKSMVYGLAGGTLAAFILFLLFGATDKIFQGTPRLICGILFGIGTLVLLFFSVWMGTLHRTFDYNGKRKLAKTIIDGTAKYVKIPDGGTGLDVGCGSGALKKGGTFAIHDLMSKARYGDMDAFVRKLKAEGYEDVRLIDTTDGTFMGSKEASWLGLAGSTLLTGKK